MLGTGLFGDDTIAEPDAMTARFPSMIKVQTIVGLEGKSGAGTSKLGPVRPP